MFHYVDPPSSVNLENLKHTISSANSLGVATA